MNIHHLRLKEFKIFNDAHFEFKPLTLLTGANSSGKSSVINALGAMLQTKTPHLFPFELVANGSNCELGSYRDIVNGLNSNKNVGVEINISSGRRNYSILAEYRYASKGNQILVNYLSFSDGNASLEGRWINQKDGYEAKVEGSLGFEPTPDFFRAISELMTAIGTNESEHENDIPTRKNIDSVIKRISSNKGKWIRIKSKKPIEIVKELAANPIFSSAIIELRDAISTFSSSINYIGPIRSKPARFYPSRDMGIDVDPAGANAFAVLNDWKKHSPTKFKDVIKYIQKLELVSNLDPKVIKDDLLKLETRPYRHKESVNFADVGFGVSQILPIIIGDVALPKNGNLIINQPEVHLHPSSQALLANHFVERLSQRNFIIETHSEYMINRLRLLVAEGIADASKISIIFIDAGDETKIHNITINKDGSLRDVPKSFFDVYYSDTHKLAMLGF